jgi:hypothetical protein
MSFVFTVLSIQYFVYIFVDIDVFKMNLDKFLLLISSEIIKNALLYNLLGCDYFERLRE